MNSLFNKDGIIKLAPKKEQSLKRYKSEKPNQDLIDFCLNCTKEKCGGICREYKEFENKNNS